MIQWSTFTDVACHGNVEYHEIERMDGMGEGHKSMSMWNILDRQIDDNAGAAGVQRWYQFATFRGHRPHLTFDISEFGTWHPYDQLSWTLEIGAEEDERLCEVNKTNK